MPRPFWSGMSGLSWGGGSSSGGGGGGGVAPDVHEPEPAAYGGAPKSLQDGLLQIGSQACHILVQRIDSAAAEAIRGHSRRPSVSRYPKDRQGRHSNIPQQQQMQQSRSSEQYVVLLPHSGTADDVPATAAASSYPVRPSGLSSSKKSPLAFETGSRKTSQATPSTSRDFCDEDSEQWGSHFLLGSEEVHVPHTSTKWSSKGWCKPSCIPITLILILIVLVVLLPLLDQAEHWNDTKKFKWNSMSCRNSCRLSLVESIPEGLKFPSGAPKFPSTYEVWSNLINVSTSSIYIASFYWSLRGADIYPHPSAYQGEDIFNKLLETSERNVKLKIAQNTPSQGMPSADTEELARKAMAEVRSLNFVKLVGGGVLHTKFWIVDEKHIYLGSANMDWRSLTQVKELGVVIYDCPCLGKDLLKIFNVYWDLGKEGAVVPSRWPDSYATPFNVDTPMNITFNEDQANTFISSSPPPFCPTGRTGDVDAIVDLIQKAEKFVYISVMDYIPLIMYSPRLKFWPVLDNAIRTAAIDQKVTVRILVSRWNHTLQAELKFLHSLSDITGTFKNVKVEVKLFTVPASPDQQKIPFSRVNHNKYMVTDNAAYIGTSNWSGDYFTDTAGVGLIIQPQHRMGRKPSSLLVRDQLEEVFERDWNSPFATYLSERSV